MDEKLSAREIEEFQEYLDNCTDRQVEGVYEKEKEAGRSAYAQLAKNKMRERGLG